MRYPPHASITPALALRIARRGKSRLVATRAKVRNRSRRYKPLSVRHAIIKQQLPEPRHVAQACIEATARKGRIRGIDGEIGVLLRAHPAPYALRQKLRHRFAGDTRDDPAQRIGVDGDRKSTRLNSSH